ncbi:SRPBCC domain-containing protein [Flagellimonas sp. DF-77]|uniref:SRPBCC domain-containing protein n=1 Tax=Flagellimonas algarum TaxID=3230298 RepID=UPI0033941D9C
MKDNGEVGLTKESGWQMGVRKTIYADFDSVWEFLFSDKGLQLWLGPVKAVDLEVGASYNLASGVMFKITVFKPLSHIRMQWKKEEWENTSRLQLRIMRSGKNTVVSFAQELLVNKVQREEMIWHWKKVTAALSVTIA